MLSYYFDEYICNSERSYSVKLRAALLSVLIWASPALAVDLRATSTSIVAGTGISVDKATGAVTVTNAGVISLAGTANQVTVSAATGAVTLSLPQNIHTGATPTFAGLILTASANTVPVTLTGYSLTGSNASSLISLAGTLNTSGSPDVIKLAITDTARGASTKLLNIYGGASATTSLFSVDYQGNAVVATALTTGGGITVQSNGIRLDGGVNGIFTAGNNGNIPFDGYTGLKGQAAAGWTATSGSIAAIALNPSFTPASGTGSSAVLHLNPTINGTSSGTAYGLLVASKTNTLTGGAVKLASLGTTTTDGFTGYTQQLGVATDGAVSQTGVAFASLGTPANGTIQFCTDCDPPTLVDSTCTSAGTKTGALAYRVNGAWKCIS